jgi:hypothetical protein
MASLVAPLVRMNLLPGQGVQAPEAADILRSDAL